MIRMTALVALAGILPAGAGTVRIDFDHGRHFLAYKTFSWVQPLAGQSPDTLFPNQIMRERIAGLIEEALVAKGLRHVASGGDLLISYYIKVTEIPTYTTINDAAGWGWGWGWGGGISTTTTELVHEGTLVIDVTDAHQNQLVFQGLSTHTISSRPTKNTRKLAKGVDEIFEKYPPTR